VVEEVDRRIEKPVRLEGHLGISRILGCVPSWPTGGELCRIVEREPSRQAMHGNLKSGLLPSPDVSAGRV
jgi:hypothetical protein